MGFHRPEALGIVGSLFLLDFDMHPNRRSPRVRRRFMEVQMSALVMDDHDDLRGRFRFGRWCW